MSDYIKAVSDASFELDVLNASASFGWFQLSAWSLPRANARY